MAKFQADCDGLPDAPEGRPAGLVEGHHGLEPVGLNRGMDAHQLAGAVVVDAKDRGLLAVEEHGAGGIGAPHLIGLLGGDGAVVDARAEVAPWLPRGLEAVLPHEQADPLDVGVDPAIAQASVDLPVALAHERRICEHLADGGEQFVIGHEGFRPRLATRSTFHRRPLGIDGGAWGRQF